MATANGPTDKVAMMDGLTAIAIVLTATDHKPMEMVMAPITAMVAGRVVHRKMRTTGAGDLVAIRLGFQRMPQLPIPQLSKFKEPPDLLTALSSNYQ